MLTSDWTVLCLNHELKLLWKTQLLKEGDSNQAIRSTNYLQPEDTDSLSVSSLPESLQC